MTAGLRHPLHGPYRPSDFETSIGHVPGFLPPSPVVECAHPRLMLDRVLDEAAARSKGPVFVAFSGGRDSSALLAAAVQRARATGRPDPVPLTLRYADEPLADESDWQDGVVEHLGLSRWDVLDVDAGGHDLVGPLAGAALREHGLVWPAPAATRSALLRAARGGVMITGEGGDEVFADGRSAMAVALARRLVPPSAERARLCLRECAPRTLRRPYLARSIRRRLPHPWLRVATRDSFHRRLLADELREPLRRDRGVLLAVSARSPTLGAQTYRWLAAQHDTDWVEPLRDDRFVASLARWVGRAGPAGRTRTMTGLFSDLLPVSVLTRGDKASFQHAYLGEHTREFADAWQGEGVPHDLVDWRELRRTWLSPTPNAAASLLLQRAWLATVGADS